MKKAFTLALIVLVLASCSTFEERNSERVLVGNVTVNLVFPTERTVSPTLPVGVSVGNVGEWTVNFYTLDKDGKEIEYTPDNTSGTLSSSSSASYTLSAGVYKITVSGSYTSTGATQGNSITYYYGEANNVVVGKLNGGKPVSVNITVGLKKTVASSQDDNAGTLIWNMKVGKGRITDGTTVYFYAGVIGKDNDDKPKDIYISTNEEPVKYDHKFTSSDTEPVNIVTKGNGSLYNNKMASGYYRLFFKYSFDEDAKPEDYIYLDLGDNLIEIADGLTTTYNATITMPSSSDRSYYVASTENGGSANNSGLFRSYPTTFAQAVDNIVAYKETYKKNTGYCIVFLCDSKDGVLTVPEIDVSKVNELLSKGIYFFANVSDKNGAILTNPSFFGANLPDSISWKGSEKYNLTFTSDKTLKINGLNFSNIASLSLKKRARLVAENATGSTVQGEGSTETLSPVTVTVDDASNYGVENELQPFLKYSVESNVTNDVYFAYNLEIDASGESAATGYMYTEKQDIESGQTEDDPTYVRCYPEKASTTPTADSNTMLWSKSLVNGNAVVNEAYLTSDVANFDKNTATNILVAGQNLVNWCFDASGSGVYLLMEESSSGVTSGRKLYFYGENGSQESIDVTVYDTSFDFDNIMLANDNKYLYVYYVRNGFAYISQYGKEDYTNNVKNFPMTFDLNAAPTVTAFCSVGGNFYMGTQKYIQSYKQYIKIEKYATGSSTDYNYTNTLFQAGEIDMSPSKIYGEKQPSSSNYKVTDLQILGSNLYALVCDTGGYSSDNTTFDTIYSRGALVKIDTNTMQFSRNDVFGLFTNQNIDENTAEIVQASNSADLLTTFTGPRRFIARKPEELVIADDGVVKDENDDYKLKDRVVVFDLKDSSFTPTDLEDISFSVVNTNPAFSFFGE